MPVICGMTPVCRKGLIAGWPVCCCWNHVKEGLLVCGLNIVCCDSSIDSRRSNAGLAAGVVFLAAVELDSAVVEGVASSFLDVEGALEHKQVGSEG